MYLHDAWDPVYLRPTNEDTAKAGWRLWWVVPLGIITARLMATWLSEELEELALGIMAAWLCATVGYLVVQAWRHRPR